MSPGTLNAATHPQEERPPVQPGELAPGTRSASRRARGLLKSVLKRLGLSVGIVLVAVPALTVRLETLVSDRDVLFLLWSQALSLVPGLPGSYLRRCYYALTLRSCPLDFDIGFLSFFNDRRSEVGRHVYIGGGVGLGHVHLGDGVMMGRRVSILNGGDQHTFGPDGKLTPFDRLSAPRIDIGANTWLGEGCIIMAHVGERCIVGAGSVVSRPVPQGCLVVGNPARLLRRLFEEDDPAEDRVESVTTVPASRPYGAH